MLYKKAKGPINPLSIIFRDIETENPANNEITNSGRNWSTIDVAQVFKKY